MFSFLYDIYTRRWTAGYWSAVKVVEVLLAVFHFFFFIFNFIDAVVVAVDEEDVRLMRLESDGNFQRRREVAFVGDANGIKLDEPAAFHGKSFGE